MRQIAHNHIYQLSFEGFEKVLKDCYLDKERIQVLVTQSVV